MKSFLANRKSLLALTALLALVGAALWQRTSLVTWYSLRQLAAADKANRVERVERVVALDEAALPGLLAMLRQDGATDNAAEALAGLANKWGADDARSQRLAEGLRDRFASDDTQRQTAALEILAVLLRKDMAKALPAGVARPAGEMLQAARDSAEMRGPALVLAALLVERAPAGQWLDTCRPMAEKGLAGTDAKARLAAVQFVMRSPLQRDNALLGKVAGLLKDREAPVRRAALLALASARELVSDDDLLPLLHDEDAEVQHLCEMTLRSRGLSDEHIDLARLISDENPKARLKVLERLSRDSDVDVGVWLRRLSQDSSSAVRAAALRATLHYPHADLTDRLHEMERQDPSETVRQNAAFYLRLRAQKRAGEE